MSFFLLSVDGPLKIILTPQPKLNRFYTLTIREGQTIGPYQCKVDCNPPCNKTWKYKETCITFPQHYSTIFYASKKNSSWINLFVIKIAFLNTN